MKTHETFNINYLKQCLSIIAIILFCLLLPTITLISCKQQETSKTLVFVGSYTEGKPSRGIYVYTMDTKTGELTLVHTVDGIVNPSFLTLSPSGRYLYSVTKSQLKTNGTVSSFRIDTLSGTLNFLNEQSVGARNPVHLAISDDGTYVINSSYTDPSVAVLKTNIDGSLNAYQQLFTFKDSSIVRGRQDAAHIHSSNFTPDKGFLYAQDLGADKIRAFEWTPSKDSVLTIRNDLTLKVKPGSGPRHFTFHPNGKFGYGVAELSGKISQYEYQAGQLRFQKDYLSYTEEQQVYRTADIHISPDGNFLYASNRAPEENSIAIFSINTENGDLDLVGREPTYGEHPRNFAIDPSGNFLIVANQFSNNVVVFKRNRSTGTLSKTETDITVDNPSSVQIRKYAN